MQDHFDCLTYPRYKILGMISEKSIFFVIKLYKSSVPKKREEWTFRTAVKGSNSQKMYFLFVYKT